MGNFFIFLGVCVCVCVGGGGFKSLLQKIINHIKGVSHHKEEWRQWRLQRLCSYILDYACRMIKERSTILLNSKSGKWKPMMYQKLMQ